MFLKVSILQVRVVLHFPFRNLESGIKWRSFQGKSLFITIPTVVLNLDLWWFPRIPVSLVPGGFPSPETPVGCWVPIFPFVGKLHRGGFQGLQVAWVPGVYLLEIEQNENNNNSYNYYYY